MTNTTLTTSVNDDTRRGDILRALGLMGSPPEQEFNELLELAITICGKPMGALTLLDEDRQYMKARVGFSDPWLAKDKSICQYTIRGDETLMLENTRTDPRFDGNELIHGEGGIQFYAGTPLRDSEGCVLGALCVMDTEPATLTERQKAALEVLGRQVSIRLQLRERTIAIERLSEEREQSRQMFSTVLNNVPVEIYLKDAHGAILFYNNKLAQRFGIDETEWLHKTSFDLWDAETAAGIAQEDQYVMSSGKSHESFLELHEKDGRTSYWRSTKVRCDSMDGEQVLACCSVDMTEQMERERKLQEIQDELEEANRKLNSLALTDALTGLWNRRAFDSRIEMHVIAAQRSKRPMALILLDVDNFKSVNDRFGHPYGDVVLRHVAAVLNRVKRAEDVACRFGGEEFAILMPGATITGAQELAQRIIDSLHAFPWEKEAVTASLGLAMCPQNCSSDELVDSADSALYRAKREGKDRMACNGCEAA